MDTFPSATGPHGPRIRLKDGTERAWEGFGTGPYVHQGGLADYSARLLGLTPQQAEQEAARRLLPYRATPQDRDPSLFLHGATPANRHFEGDVADLAEGRPPYDCATYLEARAAFLARPGDLLVGRTRPWREAAEVFGVDAVDLQDLKHYYLCQALLATAVRHTESHPESHHDKDASPLGRVIAWLRARPHAVARPYALDGETQIFLLWLLRRTGLERLHTDANSPRVATAWNSKNHIHPYIRDAEELPAHEGMPPDRLLAAEQRLSLAHRRLGLVMPVLPGYTVRRHADEPDRFADDTGRAADLLRRRYGLRRAFFKPCEAGSGARIVGPVDLHDAARLRDAATEAHQHGDDYLLEAAVDYLTYDDGGGSRCPVAPSGHIRDGRVAPGLTLQILNGYAWEGNVFTDRAGWRRCGLPPALYDTMARAMEALHTAFLSQASVTDGSHGGLVTGGVDFAVGRIGGVFGDEVLAAAIDFNLSSHGAEYLRTFQDKSGARYAATRLFRPSATASLTAGRAAVPDADLIACVPDRWGMVAATGLDVLDAAEETRRRIDVLASAGLVHLARQR
ncbi:hypothetical protein GPA10_24405 [Streptomyces sp. p1417]|uniref:Uncharacterized protein n=1 Tax=Streptomyces typhae TaxID=2681492 RepID=A0A6L6X1W5_9ACTN|nr:hypothetical protein [Streptomyces typhae]MVO87815.1 hypothetical protein [Streptomyces typhae]